MTACSEKESAGQPSDGALPDGQYRVEVELTGGSGRATVESPALLAVQDGALTASVVWSSDSYDYMVVGDETYFPVNETGNSTFEIPVAALDEAYRWALVVGPDRDYCWILARDKQLDPALREAITARAKALGIDTSALIWVEHGRQDPAA